MVSTAAATILATLVMTAIPAAAVSLATEQWDKRVVIVFGPEGDGKVREQIDLLTSDQKGLEDRDMVVLAVSGNQVETKFGVSKPGAPFSVILVGKDGGEKLRRSDPISREDLFGTIDAMPMRQREMKSGG